MKAEIISIGTELLLGNITDTNATFLTQRLAALGVECYFVSQVGDNQQRIVDTLRRAVGRSELTITTGGLGPTGDDLTRESIAALLDESPAVVPQLEAGLRRFFSRRGVPMPEQNLKQAWLIPSAQILRNPVGTAPGWLTTVGGSEPKSFIVSMPGVPFEMKRMWIEEVEPWLRPRSSGILFSRTLKVLGLGESAVEEKVLDLMTGANPTVAPYAKADGISLRITAKAQDEDSAMRMIEPVEREIRSRLGDAVYGMDDDTPAGVVADLLARAEMRLATLEIGQTAIGSLTKPLAVCDNLVGSISGHSQEDVARILDVDNKDAGIRELNEALLDRSGAQLALAVRVDERPGISAGSVGVDAEIVLTGSQELGAQANEAAKSAWNTSQSEVARLVGLSALNMLRLWLLECEYGHAL